MLTEFYLDNSFFESENLLSKGNNRSFIEKWKEYGVLILSEDQSEEIFLNKLKEKIKSKKIPASVYQYWQDAFLDNSVFLSNNNCKNFCDYSDYSDVLLLSNQFKTGVTEETTYGLLRTLPNYTVYCAQTCFEVLDVDDHHSSKNIQKSYYESRCDIDRDSSINDVWKNKFHALAKYSKNIVIIDRYLFENIRKDIGLNKKTSFDFFMFFLKQYSRKYNIIIISMGGVDKSDEQFPIKNYFEKLCDTDIKETFNKIELISKGEKFFKKISHDRFISFDKFVCTIGNGFSIFQDYPIAQTSFNIVREEYSSISERIKLAKNSCEWEVEYLSEQK